MRFHASCEAVLGWATRFGGGSVLVVGRCPGAGPPPPLLELLAPPKACRLGKDPLGCNWNGNVYSMYVYTMYILGRLQGSLGKSIN